MFTRKATYIKSNSVSSDLFIENNDYNNSELLYKIDHYRDWFTYKVTKYERRIDLIADDIYGNKNYSWLLLYMNKIENNDIMRGMELRYISPTQLTQLINNI